MKASFFIKECGSVLIVALMTITILTMICAASLYVATQNGGSGMQTAGWQQALTAAESGLDAAIRALNTSSTSGSNAWTNWKKVGTGTLPTSEPSTGTGSNASGPPISGEYSYLPSSASQVNITFPNSEGATSASAWVTIDTAGSSNLLYSGQQGYRIRSTGKTIYPANSTILSRVSNNRLDSDLRNTIAMKFNRKTGNSSSLGPTRTIEIIVRPIVSSMWGQGALLRGALSMSLNATMDHFNSTTTSSSTFLSNPSLYRSSDNSETVVGMLNANGSNLLNTYTYGAIAYSTSGSAPQNTSHVLGGLSTPFNQTVSSNSNPTWTPDVTYGSAPSTITPGSNNNSSSNPYKVKVNGNFSANSPVTIKYPNSGNGKVYVEVWVTGSLKTSVGGYIAQENNVHVTYYVDSGVDISGGSTLNATGTEYSAVNANIIVVGSGGVNVSNGSKLVASVNAPDSAFTISGNNTNFVGAIIGKTLNISLTASFHYDDALSTTTGSATVGSYAFDSWFEDNSDPVRKDINLNPIVY